MGVLPKMIGLAKSQRKMDDLGVPPPILGNLHMKSISSIISWFHTFWHHFSWGLRRYFFQELAAAGGDTVLFHCRDTENTKIVVLLGFMFVHVCYQG